MLIAETFYSIQGEGELTGVPSFFIRTSGCNLRCSWCDTPYASWRPEGTQRIVAQLVSEVCAQPGRHVVLTGGEPMIAPELPALAAALRAAGLHITIETAGTVAPAGIACDLASISPKLANSTPAAEAAGEGWAVRHEATRWQPAVVRDWVSAYDYQLKFVAAEPADLEEIAARLAELACGPNGTGPGVKIPAHKVLVMPEGITQEGLRSRAGWLGEACKARGWRYAHRLHVELYGNRRGT
jgi:7-carboxy-7-deazaguanine synthase